MAQPRGAYAAHRRRLGDAREEGVEEAGGPEGDGSSTKGPGEADDDSELAREVAEAVSVAEQREKRYLFRLRKRPSGGLGGFLS